MRLLLTLQQRFRRASDGGIYANTVFNYPFFKRYLEVFDEVLVFARVGPSEQDELPEYRADGPGVRFIEVPYYVGPFQYLKQRRRVHASAAEAVSQADAFMLRLPGLMGNLIWAQLQKRGIPYGVEVVGDPWDSACTCGAPFWLIPYLRIVGYRTLKKQCTEAAVAAYVTERILQKRYPPGGWTTCYSSIELPACSLLTPEQMEQKVRRLREPFDGLRPFRICHVGTMEALYKDQFTLIRAISLLASCFPCEVYLAGDGRYRRRFEREAAQCGVAEKILFQGELSSGQVQNLLDQSDLFVLPSLTEGLPRALIEAMARGLPCLASSVGGNVELLSGDYLFSVQNYHQLAEKIRWMLTSYDRLVASAKNNLLKAAEYTSERLISKRNECYRKLREITERYQNASH